MWQPALPEVSGQRTPALAPGAGEQELLPTRYVHAVFTVPRELAPLALQNKKVIFNLLFRASAATLLEVAADPRHLGAEIGFFSVLHTCDQLDCCFIRHVCIACWLREVWLPESWAAGLSSSRRFFLPIKVLSRALPRGKILLPGSKERFNDTDHLRFHHTLLHLADPRRFAAWLRTLFRHDWVVYAKRPFGGPGARFGLSRRWHSSRGDLQPQARCSECETYPGQCDRAGAPDTAPKTYKDDEE